MKSERLVYKKIGRGDVEFVHAALSNSELTRYYGVHFNSIAETHEQMDWYQSLIEEKKGIWWKVQNIKSGEWIGAAGFNDWDHQKKAAEIGCWILPDFWGKGFGTEIMEFIIEYGFKEMELNYIEGFIDSKNEGIKKVLKKIDFEHFKSFSEKDSKNGLYITVDHFRLKRK